MIIAECHSLSPLAWERSQVLVASSHEAMRRLGTQIERTQQRLSASQEVLDRVAHVAAVPFHEVVPLGSEPGSLEAGTNCPVRTFEAVTELIEQIERSTAGDLALTASLIEDIVLAIRRVTDPSMLMGILLQGIVSTMEQRLPVPERRETAIALCGILWDRINQDQDKSGPPRSLGRRL